MSGESALLLVLIGYFIVHLFEHTLAPHFHFGEETHLEEMSHQHARTSVLVGLTIHTFFDGVAIAAGFLVSTWLGAVMFFAVFLHKLPEGFTVASVVLASGQGKRNAILAAGLLGVATVTGVALTTSLQGQLKYALPLSGGVTLYVAATDLLPEVNREPNWRMALLVCSTYFTSSFVVLSLPIAPAICNFLRQLGFDTVWRLWPGRTSN